METYENGHMSMNALMSFLSRAFSHDAVTGETPGGDCWIHISVAPDAADDKLANHGLFEAETFEDIPNVQGVERNADDEYVRLDVEQP